MRFTLSFFIDVVSFTANAHFIEINFVETVNKSGNCKS